MNKYIYDSVAYALAEDIGDGDLTAGLISSAAVIEATIITRDAMTLAGLPWVEEVMQQVNPNIEIDWQHADGDSVDANSTLCQLRGPARSILTAERTALNFLQFLSSTATTTASYVAAVSGTGCKILDTRKTIPGQRLAQKYAVRCGGGVNHRIGLYDAILIKENHIMSAGSITAAIKKARELHAEMPIEIEVESVDELRDALSSRAERLLLDNFSLEMLREAVAINRDEGDPPAELEASGGLTIEDLRKVAETGVDYISVGALTKNVNAVDLSMRFLTGSDS
jgi:nicotinate-nucleotide pyrophosphorylase (carboxylating)